MLTPTRLDCPACSRSVGVDSRLTASAWRPGVGRALVLSLRPHGRGARCPGREVVLPSVSPRESLVTGLYLARVGLFVLPRGTRLALVALDCAADEETWALEDLATGEVRSPLLFSSVDVRAAYPLLP